LSNLSNGGFPLPNRNFRHSSQLYILILVVAHLLLISCDSQAQFPEQVSRTYKAEKDYVSLAVLSGHLYTGMEQAEVVKLLGKPDYSPVSGQYYYSSDRRETVLHGKKEMRIPVGLIIDYRDEQGRVTEQLQAFRLGRIGE